MIGSPVLILYSLSKMPGTFTINLFLYTNREKFISFAEVSLEQRQSYISAFTFLSKYINFPLNYHTYVTYSIKVYISAILKNF